MRSVGWDLEVAFKGLGIKFVSSRYGLIPIDVNNSLRGTFTGAFQFYIRLPYSQVQLLF